MIPINSFLIAFLAIYLISSFTEIAIDLMNETCLRKNGEKVPDVLKGMIDEKKITEMNAYGLDKSRLTLKHKIADKITFLVIILFGILPRLSDLLQQRNFLLAGLIFFAVPGLIGAVVDLPFDYYHIFYVEERYGFNRRTVKIWMTDLFKTLLLAVVLGGVLLSMLLFMVHYAGPAWWIWAWTVFVCFQVLVLILYPTVIAPLFNKFTPVEDKQLISGIKELSNREGIDVKGVFQMDAARRSRHTNAYFAGLGRSKRIVLYDTLLESHDADEVLAVLAHEIGHVKKGHIRKHLLLICVVSLILSFLASRMITWKFMYAGFGFSSMPAYAGLFLIVALWEPIGFLLSPFGMALSRRFEQEADRYAYKALGTVRPLISALRRMALDNLSNLRPHPMYVRFNYSHPPLRERIEKLKNMVDQ